MNLRIAVVTDALSPDLIFPIWFRYYGGMFGPENIFLVTYQGLATPFKGFSLGGLIELPVGYDDETRRCVIGGIVNSLLSCYDCVVRVDADEFLLVDPRRKISLKAYLQSFEGPYLSARGFDVCQLEDEPALGRKPVGPILRNRGYAYPNTALNKTCIIRAPMEWSVGFHWANVFPKFGPVFMLHMKRLDIGWQLAWYERMSENIKSNENVPDSLRTYYAADAAQVKKYHEGVGERERLTGIEPWYRQQMIKAFLDKIELEPTTGLYVGSYDHELVLCEIPQEWKDVL